MEKITQIPVVKEVFDLPAVLDKDTVLDGCREKVSNCTASCAEDQSVPYGNLCSVFLGETVKEEVSLCGCLPKSMYDAQPNFIKRPDIMFAGMKMRKTVVYVPKHEMALKV